MKNEEFQRLLLEQLSGLRNDIVDIKEKQQNMEMRQQNMEVRQDEIYQVVRTIEHSNQVGKSELDKHEFRIAKM